MRCRFKDLQRVDLDRHSYEIQIKQLTHKIAELDLLKKENEKLKDFLSKQGVQRFLLQNQLEALQLNFRDNISNEEFNLVYGKAIERMKTITAENQELKSLNEALQNQINSFNAKLEAFEKAKSKEL